MITNNIKIFYQIILVLVYSPSWISLNGSYQTINESVRFERPTNLVNHQASLASLGTRSRLLLISGVIWMSAVSVNERGVDTCQAGHGGPILERRGMNSWWTCFYQTIMSPPHHHTHYSSDHQSANKICYRRLTVVSVESSLAKVSLRRIWSGWCQLYEIVTTVETLADMPRTDSPAKTFITDTV